MAFRKKLLIIRFSKVINLRKWYFAFLPPVFLYNLSSSWLKETMGTITLQEEARGCSDTISLNESASKGQVPIYVTYKFTHRWTS
jgi:hypothetical protein